MPKYLIVSMELKRLYNKHWAEVFRKDLEEIPGHADCPDGFIPISYDGDEVFKTYRGKEYMLVLDKYGNPA